MQPDWWEVTHPGVGTNRYAYSFNDPVNLSDPNGNVVPVIAALALIGIFAADSANAPGPNSEVINERPLEDALGVLLPVEEIQDAANGDVSVGTVLGAAPQSRFPKKAFGWLKKKKRGATNRTDPSEVGGISGVRPHPDGPAAGGRKPQYQADGGLDQARNDFETAVGGEFTELPNGNLRGIGPNGENIILNRQSTGGLNPNVTGPPTIYINGSAIRYD